MTLTVINPATEEPIAELEPCGAEETGAAVARAPAAFPAWIAVAPGDRARLLRRLAKQSGFGRELGPHALEGYSEVRNVFLAV